MTPYSKIHWLFAIRRLPREDKLGVYITDRPAYSLLSHLAVTVLNPVAQTPRRRTCQGVHDATVVQLGSGWAGGLACCLSSAGKTKGRSLAPA